MIVGGKAGSACNPITSAITPPSVPIRLSSISTFSLPYLSPSSAQMVASPSSPMGNLRNRRSACGALNYFWSLVLEPSTELHFRCFYRQCVSICALGVIICAPHAARGEPSRFPDGKITILTPQFTAEAVSFRAIDESGWDRPGSDEAYAVFSDGSPNNLITSTYDDVDPGETRTLGPQERCITPRSKCDVHGVSQILRFEVAFFEEDSCPGRYCHGITRGAHQQLL